MAEDIEMKALNLIEMSLCICVHMIYDKVGIKIKIPFDKSFSVYS